MSTLQELSSSTSTTLSPSDPESTPNSVTVIPEEPEDLTLLTPIQSRYTFWYRATDFEQKNGSKVHVTNVNYKDTIKKIASFGSVERFWQIYDHLKRPSEFKFAEFHIFRDGIFPMWEDPENANGGKWMLRLKKGISSRYYEDLLFAIIGEQLAETPSEICGMVLSIRASEDIISIWNKSGDNKDTIAYIRDQICRILRLPSVISLEYKLHQAALEGKSSYRNPSMVFRPPSNKQSNSNMNQDNNNQSNQRYNRNNNNLNNNSNNNNYNNNNYNMYNNNRHNNNMNNNNNDYRKKDMNENKSQQQQQQQGGGWNKPQFVSNSSNINNTPILPPSSIISTGNASSNSTSLSSSSSTTSPSLSSLPAPPPVVSIPAPTPTPIPAPPVPTPLNSAGVTKFQGKLFHKINNPFGPKE